MHRAIGALVHGILDYLLVILLIFGPSLAGFTGRQAKLCWLLAAVHFVLTVLTRFPLGIKKIVGLPIHGAIEAIVGVLLLILPWLHEFSRGVLSRNFFVGVGVLVLAIWAMTDYRGIRGRAAGPAAPTKGPSETSSTTSVSS